MSLALTRTRRAGRMTAWLGFCLLGACATPEPTPNPMQDYQKETLIEDLNLEGLMGNDLALVSLHAVKLSDQIHLAIFVDRGSDEQPMVIYLPARLQPGDEGLLITLSGDTGDQLTCLLPAYLSRLDPDLTHSFSSLELEVDYPDGRTDEVHVDIDQQGDNMAALSIWCRRLGPASWWWPWGREVLYEQEPLAVTVRRTLSPQRASVWLARHAR